MSLVEFIGFIISFLAMIFLFFKNMKEAQSSKELPQDDGEENDPLKEFLKTFEGGEKVEKSYPTKQIVAPPIQVAPVRTKRKEGTFSSLDTYKLETQVEKRKLKTAIETRKMKTNIEDRSISLGVHGRSLLMDKTMQTEGIARKVSRAEGVLKQIPSNSEMVILHAIWDKPKGFNP